ncbi:MAG: hypothetical protein KDH96_12560, partial [Candidatus Riesia sp.]|nr:hypothetical protein [Candidatus Riesia sp.]
IAYLHVAQNQQLVRGSLNTAPDFSPKFQQYKEQFSEVSQPKQNIFTSEEEKTSKMFIQLASATRALKESSNTMYDDIISSFNYQLTDQDLCCLVQIFGKIGNPDIMFTIASLLRILATNLSGEIIRIENLISRALANLAQDSLFELMSKINKFYYKLVHKITKAFTTDFKNLTACNGMFILGWALIHSVNSIFDQVNAMMKEISALIGGFGTNNPGSWTIAADRRHLLGTARLLEVLAQRLDLANNCDLSQNSAISTNISISDDPAQFNTAILSILEETPPNLTIPEEEKQKHFANIPKYTSENLKFDFGIASEQNSETEGATVRDCNKPASPEQLEALYTNIQNAINETFNG